MIAKQSRKCFRTIEQQLVAVGLEIDWIKKNQQNVIPLLIPKVSHASSSISSNSSSTNPALIQHWKFCEQQRQSALIRAQQLQESLLLKKNVVENNLNVHEAAIQKLEGTLTLFEKEKQATLKDLKERRNMKQEQKLKRSANENEIQKMKDIRKSARLASQKTAARRKTMALEKQRSDAAAAAAMHDEKKEKRKRKTTPQSNSTLDIIEEVKGEKEKLDEKRKDHWKAREKERVEKALEQNRMNERRAEAAFMTSEDKRSAKIRETEKQRQMKTNAQQKFQDAQKQPIYTGVQKIRLPSSSFCSFRVSIFRQAAKGYVLDSFRIAVFDPIESTTYALTVSQHEFTHTQMYPETREGFQLYCQWLCIVYERRKRIFEMRWAGPKCPPPLRCRRDDMDLIMAYKAGHQYLNNRGYFLVEMGFRVHRLEFQVVNVDVSTNEVIEIPVSVQKDIVPTLKKIGNLETNTTQWVWQHTSPHSSSLLSSSDQQYQQSRQLVYSSSSVGKDVGVSIELYETHSSDGEEILEVILTQAATKFSKRETFSMSQLINPYHLPLKDLGLYEDLISQRILDIRQSSSMVFSSFNQKKWKKSVQKYLRRVKLGTFGLKFKNQVDEYCLIRVFLVQHKTQYPGASLVFQIFSIVNPSPHSFELVLSLSNWLKCGKVQHLLLEEEKKMPSGDQQQCLGCSTDNAIHSHLSITRLAHGCKHCQLDFDTRWKNLNGILDDYFSPGSTNYQSKQVSKTSSTHKTRARCSYCHQDSIKINICYRIQEPVGNIQRLKNILILSGILTSSPSQDYSLRAADIGITRKAVHTMAQGFVEEIQGEGFSIHERHLFLLLPSLGVVSSAGFSVIEKSELPECVQLDRDLIELEQSSHVILEQLKNTSSDRENFDFDQYLIVEALIVECVLVMIYPKRKHHGPGITLGASSWREASEFSSNPQALAEKLRNVRFQSNIHDHHLALVYAHLSHSEWPKDSSFTFKHPIWRHLKDWIELSYSYLRTVKERGGWKEDRQRGGTGGLLLGNCEFKLHSYQKV